MTKIWERLYIGGLADAVELADDNPHRITTVVSLSEIPVEAKRKGVNYLHLPIADDEHVPVRQFDRILDAIAENIRWGTVLIHCNQGMSRAPSMAAAYIDSVGCKGIDAALDEIRKLRPFVHPSSTVLKSLKENLQ
jgi:dual specificity phosphatase 12